MIIEWMPEPEVVLEADSQETDEVSIIKAAISHMAQGLVVYNANSELVFHNAAYRAIYKLRKEDLYHSMPIGKVIERQALSLGLAAEGVAEFNSPYSQNTTRSWSAIRRLPDGRSVQMSRRSMRAGYFVVTHEDITDRVKMENEIRYAANHDNLTGLANRKAFLDNLEVGLKRARRGESIALLAIDLDGFKAINDTHGHAIGDKVLKLVADRIRATARDTDVASRFGGDEFSIIQLPAQDVSDAERLSARIVDALAAPFSVDGQTLIVGASVGVALADEGTKDIESLMQNADLALYRAKTDGKGCYRFFDDKLNQIMRRRRIVEARMRSAVENEQFALYYQPIVNVESRRVESVEALLRWNDNGNWISPGEFIPIAEQTGMIIPLGDWVIQEACRQAAQWPKHVNVSVNVSPLQFRTNRLVGVLQDALASTGLEPSRLKIEITESLLIDETADVVATLHAIDDLGVRFALDDFGTGYSSLRYLTSFPFNRLKVDRSFVSDLPKSSQHLAIVRAAAALGRDLGIETVVEGVESPHQLAAVRAAGCKHIQGFYFARPTPPEALAAAITAAEAMCELQDTSASHSEEVQPSRCEGKILEYAASR
mgnify:CR=1 FL=1